MKPYYDQDGITIYHADCADVLPGIDPSTVDLLLTDPPYGANVTARQRRQGTTTPGDLSDKWGPGSTVHPDVVGDDKPFDPTPLLVFGRCIIWGGNCFASRLPDWPGWIAWDKVTRNGFDNHRIAELEFAWTNFVTRPRLFRHMWAGAFRDSERHTKYHPTQKPVSLMKWVLGQWSEPDDLILDPYMGSGPVAEACYQLGRRYIGVEIEERYCEIAVQRLAQGVLQFGT